MGTFSTYVPLDHFALLSNKSNNLSHDDEVAEWLRRWTANPMCSARVGSNPILVDIFYYKFEVFQLKKVHEVHTNLSPSVLK